MLWVLSFFLSFVWIKIVLLTDFGHGDQSQRRSAICAGDIIVHKSVRRHRCTLYSFTLIIRWDGNPTRPERDQAQDQRLNVLSEARGYHTENFLLEKPNSTFCPTRESNPGPHAQQLHLRPLDQRGSQCVVWIAKTWRSGRPIHKWYKKKRENWHGWICDMGQW